MNLSLREATKDFFYSPSFVIHASKVMAKLYTQDSINSDTIFQKINEMKISAILAMALHKIYHEKYYLQVPKERTPDIYIVNDENENLLFQNIEVVEYNSHEGTPLDNFIVNHKLTDPTNPYDEDTIILCYVRRSGFSFNPKYIHSELSKHTFKPKYVFVIGLLDDKVTYKVSKVWPDRHTIDVTEEDYYLNKKNPPRMKYHRKLSESNTFVIKKTDIPIDPHDVFKVDAAKIKSKIRHDQVAL